MFHRIKSWLEKKFSKYVPQYLSGKGEPMICLYCGREDCDCDENCECKSQKKPNSEGTTDS